MMKKGMIRFLATGMTALTLMGATVAFAPAKQVFAAEAETETETIEDTYETIHDVKTMTAREAKAYVKELVGEAAPFAEIGNTKMYRVGNSDISIKTSEDWPVVIDQDFDNDQEAEKFYLECLNNFVSDLELKEYYNGEWEFDHATVSGKIPMVKLTIDIFMF